MIKLVPLAVLLFGCLSQALARDFLADVVELYAEAEKERLIFKEDHVGFDQHADIFYYKDDLVAKEFARTNYEASKFTLAGQADDLTGRPVKHSVNPFIVGQRTFKNFGTIKDRWDVRDFGDKYQYLALYHGKGADSVVNKLRGHLLRILANAINGYLPLLDRSGEEDAEDHEDQVADIKDKIRSKIEEVFREVDDAIRIPMKESDDTWASATVVIISKNFVTTISVGKGSVIAYDSDFNTRQLIDPVSFGGKSVFGARKSRPHEHIQPNVEFYQRTDPEFHFVLIESPSVAEVVDEKAAVNAVLSSVNLHKKKRAQEQELYSSAVIKILNQIKSTRGMFYRYFTHSDYSVMLVGLQRDYNMIH